MMALPRIAEVSLRSPKEQVETVIYPVVGGVEGLTDLVNEHKARSRAYEREKRKVFRSSYTNHYRTGLIKLLRLLEFRSNRGTAKISPKGAIGGFEFEPTEG